jgi:hypothetical protein
VKWKKLPADTNEKMFLVWADRRAFIVDQPDDAGDFPLYDDPRGVIRSWEVKYWAKIKGPK